jgi:hypothetical protein
LSTDHRGPAVLERDKPVMISVVLAGASALPLNPRGFGMSRWQLYNEVYHFDRNWKGRRFSAFTFANPGLVHFWGRQAGQGLAGGRSAR